MNIVFRKTIYIRRFGIGFCRHVASFTHNEEPAIFYKYMIWMWLWNRVIAISFFKENKYDKAPD